MTGEIFLQMLNAFVVFASNHQNPQGKLKIKVWDFRGVFKRLSNIEDDVFCENI